MKLEKGKRYWCGWACRYATYDKTISKKKHNEIIQEAQFIDVCDAIISCDVRVLEKWVRDKK